MTISISILSFADILHHAADHCLHDGSPEPSALIDGTHGYSCLAITEAVRQLTGKYPRSDQETACLCWYRENFLQWNAHAYRLFTADDQLWNVPYALRQQIRYAHLKFAAMIAEEEGL